MDDELGAVSPDEFIPIAEQTGVITLLNEWVLEQAIRDQILWRRAGIDISVSINVSGIDVLKQEFMDELLRQMTLSALPMEALVIEVTETAMMADANAARDNLKRIEAAGIRVSIDDYGTGFSSLAQLRSLPVRELKLDRSLVENIDQEPGDRLIVKSTIDMAHLLGLSVVAEGVETNEILAELYKLDCDGIQGYLLSKPVALDVLTAIMRSDKHVTSGLQNALNTVHAA